MPRLYKKNFAEHNQETEIFSRPLSEISFLSSRCCPARILDYFLNLQLSVRSQAAISKRPRNQANSSAVNCKICSASWEKSDKQNLSTIFGILYFSVYVNSLLLSFSSSCIVVRLSFYLKNLSSKLKSMHLQINFKKKKIKNIA